MISIGADFLDGWGANVPQQMSFADARAKLQDGPRFVYIGARRSLTGLNADQWIACTQGSEGAIASALLGAVGGGGTVTIAAAAQASGVTEATLQALADELRAASPSLVVSGVSTPEARSVATTVAAINRATGAIGVTVKPAEALSGFGGSVGVGTMQAVVNGANAGSIKLLFVRGVNPADTRSAPLLTCSRSYRAGAFVDALHGRCGAWHERSSLCYAEQTAGAARRWWRGVRQLRLLARRGVSACTAGASSAPSGDLVPRRRSMRESRAWRGPRPARRRKSVTRT